MGCLWWSYSARRTWRTPVVIKWNLSVGSPLFRDTTGAQTFVPKPTKMILVQPLFKEHLLFREHLSWSRRCPLNGGSTVCYTQHARPFQRLLPRPLKGTTWCFPYVVPILSKSVWNKSATIKRWMVLTPGPTYHVPPQSPCSTGPSNLRISQILNALVHFRVLHTAEYKHRGRVCIQG